MCTDKELNDSWKSQYQEEHSVKRRNKKAIKIGELMKTRQEFGQILEEKDEESRMQLSTRLWVMD